MKNPIGPSKNGSSYFLIVSACLLLLLSFGYRSSFGLFVRPITEANGWGREVISMALAVQNLFWGIVAVFAGGLADRFGNVKVVVAGTLFYALGMVTMAGVDSQWVLHSSAGILVGAGIAGTSFGIVLPAMARAVGESRRQMALGLGTAAGSLGQFAIVPLAQQLINGLGWITALNILAVSAMAMALLAIPLAPYSGKAETVSLHQDQTVFQALQEALNHRSFLLLVGIYIGRAIAITFFLLLPMTLPSVLIFSAVMGFLWLATVPPTSGLVAVMFGTRYMALLYGIVFLGHQLGSFSGVWLGGWLYDRSGSYDMVWWLGMVFSVMAAIVHWPIEERPVLRLAPQNAKL